MLFLPKQLNLGLEFDYNKIKMKKTLYIFITILLISCSKPSDCVESTGNSVSKVISVASFDKIKVYNGIELIISQGVIQKVEVVTGENLISDIEVKVENNTLILTDKTTCNWVREYGQTKVYVTSVNITDVISKTEKNVSSNGVLTYPVFRMQSLDLSDGAGTGDFHIQVNNSQVVIESNNVSNFYISGTTNNFLSNFYEGQGRVEAANLLVNTISVFHRGSGDMILNPQTSIEGNIYSTGNVICKTQPTIVNVIQHYQGRLIFN
jgi:Putative auto-transporter adhesin, head GIN domain